MTWPNNLEFFVTPEEYTRMLEEALSLVWENFKMPDRKTASSDEIRLLEKWRESSSQEAENRKGGGKVYFTKLKYSWLNFKIKERFGRRWNGHEFVKINPR